MKTITIKVEDELYYEIIAFEKMNKKCDNLGLDRRYLLVEGLRNSLFDGVCTQKELEIFETEYEKIKMKELNKKVNLKK